MRTVLQLRIVLMIAAELAASMVVSSPPPTLLKPGVSM
jgi:hypothetical protein